MDLNARVDVNCGRKDGLKTGCLYRTLLKQVRQKSSKKIKWQVVRDTSVQIFSINI